MFKDLINCEPSGATNIAWQERYSAFGTGQAAMIGPWNYDIPPLDDPAQSAVAGKYEVSTVPVADGVKLNTPVGGWMMGINSFSTEKDMAWDFTQWFSSPAVNAFFMSNGGFAARYSHVHGTAFRRAQELFDDPHLRPDAADLRAHLLATRGGPADPTDPWLPRCQGVLSRPGRPRGRPDPHPVSPAGHAAGDRGGVALRVHAQPPRRRRELLPRPTRSAQAGLVRQHLLRHDGGYTLVYGR
ncbi:hypothetical protein BN13_430005 [Nostocoides jenkinsii Ben 74]|uniref:Extracellular solute-binding protein family 1 n=1 Tax=Nostocoides jenkinsii Ben 74 TaxID=1193518 RepID=A0A077M8I4_9MICO|nr:hypothetical protein BN13_430005 [Tetrasphaera jenkinsii Ben 74]